MPSTKEKYIVSLIDNKKYCKINGQFTRHLRDNNLTYQEYYENYVTHEHPKCYCGEPLSFFQKNNTYAKSCGNPKCVGITVSIVKNNWSKERKAEVSNNHKKAQKNKSPEQKRNERLKAKQTYFIKFGSSYANSPQQKLKCKNTKFINHGDVNWNNREKYNITMKNKTIEEQNAMLEKRRNTNIIRYGIACSLSLPKSKSNSGLSNNLGKDYITPSGKSIRVRGYENIVLDILFKTYSEQEIVIPINKKTLYNLPVFRYTNCNNHINNYYPDLYIPSENKIIEVKSLWWWEGRKNDVRYKSRLENNLRKRKAAIDAGYEYELWLFTSKKNYRIYKNNETV